jgi:hypothetical protein
MERREKHAGDCDDQCTQADDDPVDRRLQAQFGLPKRALGALHVTLQFRFHELQVGPRSGPARWVQDRFYWTSRMR